MSKHPMQPIILEDDGIPRFKKNSIVECVYLNFVRNKTDLFSRLVQDFSKEDIDQLSQLLGYPVAHYSGLDTSSEEYIRSANRKMRNLLKRKEAGKVRVEKHPMQPIVWVRDVIRFKKNAAVDYLLEQGTVDLNRIACMKFTTEDREQFNQLIGYSVSGYGDLSFIRRKTVRAADKKAHELYESTNGEDPNVKID